MITSKARCRKVAVKSTKKSKRNSLFCESTLTMNNKNQTYVCNFFFRLHSLYGFDELDSLRVFLPCHTVCLCNFHLTVSDINSHVLYRIVYIYKSRFISTLAIHLCIGFWGQCTLCTYHSQLCDQRVKSGVLCNGNDWNWNPLL